MGATATDVVIIEHDEDIELVRAGTHIYVRVKTRNHLLRLSDVDTALRDDLMSYEASTITADDRASGGLS